MPRTFVEVEVRGERECGYGQKFPFAAKNKPKDEVQDAYLFFGLPVAAAEFALAGARRHVSRTPNIESVDRLAERAKTIISAGNAFCPKASALRHYATDRGLASAAFYAAADRLPLSENSVDGVLFSNVICDPLLEDESKTRLIREGLRVVKPGGLVVAREVSCPIVAEDYFAGHDWPVTKIEEESPFWPEMRDMYALPGRGLIFEIQKALPQTELAAPTTLTEEISV